MARKLHFSES